MIRMDSAVNADEGKTQPRQDTTVVVYCIFFSSEFTELFIPIIFGRYASLLSLSTPLLSRKESAMIARLLPGSEGYSSGSLPGVGDPGENTMAKTVTITLGAAAIYMMLVMGLMIWCRLRRARRKAMLLLQVTSEGEE